MKYIIGVLFLLVFVSTSISLELIACISPKVRIVIEIICGVNHNIYKELV